MNIKIELNDDSASESSLSKAVEKRKIAGVGETLEDAFSRILAMKNSEPDKQRIIAVQRAMEEGRIGREQEPMEKGKKLTKAEVLRLYKRVEAAEQERILQQMKTDMPDNYVLVNTEEQLEEVVTLMAWEDVIVFDVETTGPDVWEDHIVGHVLTATSTDEHFYIPTKHETDMVQLDHDYVTDKLRDVYENAKTLKIAHNASFDIHMLRHEGVSVKGDLWDTMEAMKLLNENEESYALKKLASKFLNIPSKTYGELFGKKGFHEVEDLEIATSYAAKDGDVTYQLYEFQKKHLSESFPTIYEYAKTVEMPLIYSVIEMERNGFVIDLDRAEEYGQELVAETEQVSKRLELVFGDINLNSPVQVKKALEEHTKRTLPNTDAKKTLKPLAKDFPAVKDLLRYKELTKLYGTYVDKLPRAVNERTGRLMASFNQNGAATGRFSSGGSGVNLQNQSPEARQLFVAPPGKVWIGADFKAQEIRAVAYLSNEPKLIEAFRNERDPYATLASNIFNKPYEEVYKLPNGDDTAERKKTKIVWLATIYGMSSFSLAEMLEVSKKEAEKIQQELFDSMPKLKQWIDDIKAFVQRHGYVWMDGRKRKRRLPEAKQQRYEIPYGKYYDPKYEKQRNHNSQISRALRQGPNAIVQGSSAIQTKVTILAMEKLKDEIPGFKIVLPVHDEIIVEVDEDFTEEDAKKIEDVMVNTFPWGDSVKNGTDLEVMRRWSSGVSLDDWFNNKRKEDE